MKRGYTLVQCQRSPEICEVLYLPNKRKVQQVKAAGGIVVETAEEANTAKHEYNYGGVDTMSPNATALGFFAMQKVSGQAVYVPRSTS